MIAVAARSLELRLRGAEPLRAFGLLSDNALLMLDKNMVTIETIVSHVIIQDKILDPSLLLPLGLLLRLQGDSKVGVCR